MNGYLPLHLAATNANPDVFIDYENFYTLLAPGGVMAVDDIELVPSCRDAWHALLRRYGLTAKYVANQAYVRKPLKPHNQTMAVG